MKIKRLISQNADGRKCHNKRWMKQKHIERVYLPLPGAHQLLAEFMGQSGSEMFDYQSLSLGAFPEIQVTARWNLSLSRFALRSSCFTQVRMFQDALHPNHGVL